DPQPPHDEAAELLRTGNSVLGTNHSAGFSSRDAIRAAEAFSSARRVASLQNSQLPCGGISTPSANARKCATSHKNSTGDSGSPVSSSPVAGQALHADRMRQPSHLLG